jgi:S1-C subfamily serine protease
MKLKSVIILLFLLTIAHFNPGNCGFGNSKNGYRNIDSDKQLYEVFKNIGAYDLGSGFVYQYKGQKYVITCEHVIFNSDSIVGYDQAYNPFALDLLGSDTFYDVAVLKFKNKEDEKKWKGLRFDFTPETNTDVFAFGFWPWDGGLNFGQGNLINKSTSITARELPIVKIGFLTSDAPSFGGYSGGALFNTEGQVIGMNSMVHTQNKKSFALNSSIIKDIIHDLIDSPFNEKLRSFLGIRFSQKVNEGVVIIEKVLDNSPAAKFKDELEGKILKSITSNKVTEIYDPLKVMEMIKPGELVNLEVGDSFDCNNISIISDTLNDRYHAAIATHAIRENKGDECMDIEIVEGDVYIYTSDQKRELAMTAGLNNNRIYCLNDLVQLGKIVRIFSLHGELRIGLDESFRKGRWVWFSDSDDKRVLYY